MESNQPITYKLSSVHCGASHLSTFSPPLLSLPLLLPFSLQNPLQTEVLTSIFLCVWQHEQLQLALTSRACHHWIMFVVTVIYQPAPFPFAALPPLSVLASSFSFASGPGYTDVLWNTNINKLCMCVILINPPSTAYPYAYHKSTSSGHLYSTFCVVSLLKNGSSNLSPPPSSPPPLPPPSAPLPPSFPVPSTSLSAEHTMTAYWCIQTHTQ